MAQRRIVRILALTMLLGALPVMAEPAGTNGSFRFRIGGFFPSGNSEFWDANEATFTLDASDFQDWMIGASFVSSMSNWVELGFNVDFYDASQRSAYRDFTDEFGNAILHDTRLELIPLSADVRILPAGRYAFRGRGGQLKVRRPVPYVGAGIGMTYWEYEEEGDFVGFDSIGPFLYYDRLKDSGTDFAAHVLAGVEFPMGPSWSLTLEGRYTWAEATPGGAFSDLQLGDLDLGGFAGFFGFSNQF
jgi:hypothetical protein